MANGQNTQQIKTQQPDEQQDKPDQQKAGGQTTGQKDQKPAQKDTDQQKGPTDPFPNLKTLHERLVQVQSQADIEGIPEDYDQFNQWFQDPEYRQKFHQFLLDQQRRGTIQSVPENFNEFQAGLAGEQAPDMAEEFNFMADLPSQLKQLDIDVDQAAETAFDSTAALDDLDSMEAWEQAQARKARKAAEEYLGPSEPTAAQPGHQTPPKPESSEDVYFTRSGGLHFRDPQKEQQMLTARREEKERYEMAEMRYRELQQQLRQGQITESEYKSAVDDIWWGDWPQTFEESAKGLARGVVSVLPAMFSEFMGQFYYDPFDAPINGPSKQTLEMRKDWQDLADWFNELGENEWIAVHNELKNKTLDDVLENPALMPSWLGAKAGETAPSMLPGIAAIKVIRPVSTAGQFASAMIGATPIEVGAQLQELRKTAEQKGEKVEEWQKALAVGSGLAAAAFEGVADRFVFKYVSDALKGSGLNKATQGKIAKEVGERLARRYFNIVKSSGKQSGIEGFTESVQQTLANVGAQYGWDPDRTLLENVPEATVIGATVGGTTTLSFGVGAESIRQNRELESSMEGSVKEDLGPIKPVTITVPTSGPISEQLEALQRDKQRILQEMAEAEKEGRPTIDHDMALTRLSIIQDRVMREMREGRKEAIELRIEQEERGPQPRQTEEAQQRRQQAVGEGTLQPQQPSEADTTPSGAPATEVPRRDVSGQQIVPPGEFLEMSEAERRDYVRPLKQNIPNADGGQVEVDAGLAPFARAATAMGIQISEGDSGLQIDHPGDRSTETGELENRGSNARITFTSPEAAGSRNTPQKISNVKQAARQAGFNVQDQEAPFQPGTTISLPLAADGSSEAQLTEEANNIANTRWPGLRDENFGLWQRRRDAILSEEVIPNHGGVREWTDQEVLDRWEAFTQNLEQLEGQAPDQRTSFEIDTEASPAEQFQQARSELRRIRRNRDIAESRGLPTEEFGPAIERIQQRMNEIRNQQRQAARRSIAQQGTISEALGETVTMGEYTGTLAQDAEGNIVIQTEDQVVEVPDTFKNLSTPLSETDIARTPPLQRDMRLIDADAGRFVFEESDALLGEVQRSEEFTFLESNTNEAGEVVSVTMAGEQSGQRTFRDPQIVEQVIWQQYFGRGTSPQDQIDALQSNIEQAEQELSGDEAPEFRLDDGDPRVNVVFQKFDNGQPLSEAEQIRALDWIQEKVEQLQQASPENEAQLFNFLIAFENEIIDNRPQQSAIEQPESPLEAQGQVSPAPAEQPEEGDIQGLQEFENEVVAAAIQLPEPTQKYYFGRTHTEAIQKAVDDGLAFWEEIDSGLMKIPNDLFLKGDGEIVTREEAAEIIGNRLPDHTDLPRDAAQVAQRLLDRGAELHPNIIEAFDLTRPSEQEGAIEQFGSIESQFPPYFFHTLNGIMTRVYTGVLPPGARENLSRLGYDVNRDTTADEALRMIRERVAAYVKDTSIPQDDRANLILKMPVYRGEYGLLALQTDLSTISFTDSREVAQLYAESPNNVTRTAEDPFIISADVDMQRPFVHLDDRFIDLEDLVRAFESEAYPASRIREILIDNFEWSRDGERVFDEEVTDDSYADTYRIFDSEMVLDMAREAGYDGFVYHGAIPGMSQLTESVRAEAELLSSYNDQNFSVIEVRPFTGSQVITYDIPSAFRVRLEDYIKNQVNTFPLSLQENPERLADVIQNKVIPEHKEYVARALEEGRKVPEKVLQDYPDLLNDTAVDPDDKSDPQQIEVERRLVKDMTEEKFRQLLRDETDVDEQQIEAIIALVNTRANTWAKQTGRSPSEYWKRRLSGISRQLPADESVVEEVVASYGPEANSVEDVGRVIEERLNYDPDDYNFVAEGTDGRTVPFNSGRQMGFFDDVETDPEVSLTNPMTRQMEGDEFFAQEREFTVNENWNFTGPRVIDDSYTVAWMFSELENMAVEHLFLVGIDSEGTPHNIHISKGTQTSALMDMSYVHGAVQKLGLQEVWLVHNHPSGNPSPSKADRTLWTKIEQALPTGVTMREGIIIDRDSGRYSVFTPKSNQVFPIATVAEREETERQKPETSRRYDVLSYDRFNHAKNMRGVGERFQVTSPGDVTRFTQKERVQLSDKFSVLILDNSKRVVGFLHLKNQPDIGRDYDPVGPNTMRRSPFAQEVANYVSRFGGTSALLVTNQNAHDFRRYKGLFGQMAQELKKMDIVLDDVVSIAPSPSSFSSYQSMVADQVFDPPKTYRAHAQETIVGEPGSEQSFPTGEQGIIHLFENQDDFESIVRGLAKIFRRDLEGGDLTTVETWLNVQDGDWTPAQEEKFSDWFIKYLGQPEKANVPSEVKSVFARLKEWIMDIYTSLVQQDQGVTLTSDIRSAFDSLFDSPIDANRNQPTVMGGVGSSIKVSFRADGTEDHGGHFAVVEARDLQASHNTDGSINSRHGIGKAQPRDRRGRKYIAQKKQIAQNLNPPAITGNGSTAFYNAPVTNERAEVIQGNGRSIALQVAYSENPERAQGYKNYLIKEAEQWGLDPEDVGRMQRPVLVRVLPVDDSEAVRLGNLKNVDEARMDPIDEAKASVRNLPESDRRRISTLINSSEAESIREILDDVGPDIVDILPGVERADYMNSQNEMTVQGKDFLSDVFQSLIFDSQAGRDTIRKFSEMPHDIKRGIERSYGTLIRYLDTPADLSVTLQNAIDIVWNVRRNDSMETARDFVDQQDVFASQTEAYTPEEVTLAQVLLDVQRRDSELMKSIFGGPSGATQKAIITLIREYGNQIDGEVGLFDAEQPPGNTPEGAQQAFGRAFARVQEPPGGRQPGQEQEPGRQSAETRGPKPPSTETVFTRNSGLDNIRELDPLVPSDVSFLEEAPTTKKGRNLAKKIQEDPEGMKTGFRSIINYFNDQIGVEMRVGKVNTTRRRPANMNAKTYINRTRSPLDVAALHEGGHAIHFQVEINQPEFLLQFEWSEIMEPLEEAGLSRASAESNPEYFAEWVRSFIMNPEFAMSVPVTQKVLDALQQADETLYNAILDTARLYKMHTDRGTVAMTRSASKDTGPDPKTLTDKVKDTVDRFKFKAMGRNWAVDIFEREAVWKAFRQVYDSQKEADEAAREVLSSIRSTEADFRLAHQVTNRIPGIVRDALYGDGLKIFSTADGVQATPEQVDALRQAGVNIPKKLEKALTEPAGRHGDTIKLTDYAIEDVLEEIGADAWPNFEWYVQHKVSLERLVKKQAAYPGWTEVKAEDVWRRIQDFEAAHPEWKQYFEQLNDYMDMLVVSSFLGGTVSLDEAVRIVGSYEYYAPLPRNVEGRIDRLYDQSFTTGKPSPDPGFRRITGEGDHPFLPLLTAIEQRTYQAVDAYYQNRAMLAPIYMAEEMNRREDIPEKAKIPVNRLVSPIRLDRKKVADLKPEEMAQVIADYLNQQQREEAAREMEVDPSEVMISNPIKPEDINITTPGMGIWRATEPRGIHIIAPKVDGETVFYQIGNEFMYDYYARVSDPTGFTKFWNEIAKGTQPWKEILTQNLDFIGRNIPRDMFTNVILADLPEYTIDDITPAEFIRTTIPGFQLVTGFLAKITGKTEGQLVDTELLSQSMYNSISMERKIRHNDFLQELERGIFPSSWHQMSGKQKAWHLAYTAPIWILSKPFHLVLKYTGLRKASTFIEESPRAGAYMDAKSRGFSDEVAAMFHDHASGNFGESPANRTIHASYRAAGFVNPSTQIFSETIRRLTHPDSRVRWQQALRLAMIGAYTAIGWAITRAVTGEDEEKELALRTDKERMNYMPVFGVYRVPFDYGITGAVQSFVWNSLDNAAGDSDLPPDKFAKSVLKRLIDTPVSVESPSGALSSFSQMMIGPQMTGLVEGITNWKFYWEEPIVPPFLTQYPASQQAYVTTPGFYKSVGEMTGWSPLKVQHVLNNATGYLLDRGLQMSDKIMSGEGVDPADLPLGGKLVVREPTGWYAQPTQRISELDQKYLSLKRDLDTLLESRTADPEKQKQIRELELQTKKLSKFHEANSQLEKMYKRAKDMRDRGEFEKAKVIQDQMVEIAASMLSQAGLVK